MSTKLSKVIITGGTGLIGKELVKKLLRQGIETTLLTRNTTIAYKNKIQATHIEESDYSDPNQLQNIINGQNAVVHMVGANLSAKRWDNKYRKIIYESRITSTKNIVLAIERCKTKPTLLVTLSAVGIYGDRGNELLSENSEYGNDFLAHLCKDWEREAERVEFLGIRRVSLRIGLVLSKDGGVLKKLLLPFKLFAGGSLGDGNQWFPWIHIQDVIDIIDFVLNNESINGAVNCAAPGIVRMKDFSRTLGKTINRPSYINVPKFALRIISGQIADTAVSGQQISVEKLLKAGYQFKFNELEGALKNLLNKSH